MAEEQSMAELALGAQGIFQSLMGALNALPLWAVAALVFLPTLLSLFTRNPVTILSAALLNLACLALLASGSAFAAPVALAAFAASLILVLFGLRERLLWKNLSALEARVGRIDGQMMAFLEALEKRSDIMDERTEEARNAFREARQAYEEIRRAAQAPKPPIQAAPSFSVGTVGPGAGAPGNAPQKITPVETGATGAPPPKTDT
jgi:hypothetical protein